MAQDTALLRYLLKGARRAPGSGSQRDLAFAFDGTDDYISSNGNLGTGVAVKGTDGTGSYVQCYNTGFDMGTIAIDNRSVQTIKRRGSFDSFASSPFILSYRNGSVGLSSVKLQTNGTIQIELQGTGGGRITTVNTFSINTEYNIIIRINNTLPGGTARVVTDADIFVDGVKQTYTFAAIGNNTTTSSNLYRGAYLTTLGMTGKMRSLNIWNVALTDGECGAEGVSSTVVNTTGLINSYTPSNIGVNIGRTGYDMNVSGNVSTGSDGDGNYIQFNGNRDDALLTGTRAEIIGGSTPLFTQATSFAISCKFKAPTLPTGVTGLFGSNQDACIDVNATQIRFTVRGSTTITNGYSFSANTIYTCHLVYDSVAGKFYCYINGALQNAGGTAGPTTFSTDTWRLSDNAIGGGTQVSSNKYIYHACIRNKALTQAEIDTDIALGNTAKNDPSIVAYYIPDNLQYNTQYMLDPKDLSSASWSNWGGGSVTANTTVAPDGTTTADTVSILAGSALNRVEQSNLTITGSALASKTFIIKAFVKVAAATATFRLRMTHRGVGDYQSADLTATTDWQEFTFTQAFTSSTSGTGITGAVLNGTDALVKSLQVRNVRVYVTNETLRDESPNIGGFLGWKTQKVLSCRYKPNADFADSVTAGGLIYAPRAYLHDRASDHRPQIRYSDRVNARVSIVPALGVGFVSKVHVLGVVYFESGVFKTKIYKNGVLVDSDSWTIDAPSSYTQATMYNGRISTTYFSGNIRDARIYTFTGSFTDADALAIYNGGEPTSSGVTKYLHYKPPVGEVGTTTQDQSTNDRDGTLNGGVTRNYI